MKLHRLLQITLISVVLYGCPQFATKPDLSLEGPKWELVEVAGKQVQQYLDQRKPYIQFDAENRRAAGFDSCNNFSGGYTLEGNKLTFGMMASTKMACQHVMQQEAAFNDMLSTTNGYRIKGNRLELLKDGRILGRFHVVN